MLKVSCNDANTSLASFELWHMKIKSLYHKHINQEEKRELLGKLYLYLSENSYLKTIQANNAINENKDDT